MRTQQISFAGGLISPELFGRFDLGNFQTGAKQLLNCWTLPHGPMQNRGGFEHIKELPAFFPNIRVETFEFSEDQAHVLIIMPGFIRFINEGSMVVEANISISDVTNANPGLAETFSPHGLNVGEEFFWSNNTGMEELNGRFFKVKTVPNADEFTFSDILDRDIDTTNFSTYFFGGVVNRVYTIINPYLSDEVFDLVLEQSEDVVTITHPNHDTMELRRLGPTNWTLTAANFVPTIASPTVVALNASPASGSDDHDYRITAVAEANNEESLENPGVAIEGATQANPVVISATGHPFVNGQRIRITDVEGMIEINSRFFTVAGAAADTFQLSGENGTGHTAYVSGGRISELSAVNDLSAGSNENTLTWDEVTGAIRYNIYKLDNGLFGKIGQTSDLTFIDDNIAPDLLDTPPVQQTPFEGVNNKPSTVSYHDQRRIFASSNNDPTAVYMVQPSTESNLTKTIPSKDNDAIIFRLKARRRQKVQHMVSLTELVIFTTAAEWKLGQPVNEGLTPDNFIPLPQSYVGSSKLKPILSLDSIVFVQSNQSTVWDINFDAIADRWKPREISIIVPDLVEGFTIVDWAYAQIPNSMIFAVRSDGKLMGCTYLPGQQPQIIGWHLHETINGFIESITVVPEQSPTGVTTDSVYIVVKRNIEGIGERRFIERLHSRFYQEVKDAFFVDAGLTLDNGITIIATSQTNPVLIQFSTNAHGFANGDRIIIHEVEGMTELNGNSYKVNNVLNDVVELQTDDDTPVNIDGTGFSAYTGGGVAREKVTTISNLHHLEGQEVSILGDGSVQTPKTVQNGQITLASPAGLVHVGLPITSIFESLPLAMNIEGQGLGHTKTISDVYLKTNKSREFEVGRDLDNMTTPAWRTDEKLGHPTKLRDRHFQVNIADNYDLDGTFFMRQKEPLPMDVLSMAMEVDLGDE